MKVHTKKDNLGKNEVVNIPKQIVNEDATDDDEKLSCDKCGKTFKLNIMLKRHYDLCGIQAEISPTKELIIAVQPIDAMVKNKIECDICTAKFKSVENLQKHLRVVHAAAMKQDPSPKKANKVSVPCVFCRKSFDDYYIYTAHYNSCSKKCELSGIECPVASCKRMIGKRAAFFVHLKNLHFEPKVAKSEPTEGKSKKSSESFECRMCSKSLPSQEQLITHLAAHMSKIDNAPDDVADDDSR